MESLDLRGYDLVISSSSAWAHGVIPDEDAVHVCYCHNPFRYAWNAREETLAGARPARRARRSARSSSAGASGTGSPPSASTPTSPTPQTTQAARRALLRPRGDRPAPAGRRSSASRPGRAGRRLRRALRADAAQAHRRRGAGVQRAAPAAGRRRQRPRRPPPAPPGRADGHASPAASATPRRRASWRGAARARRHRHRGVRHRRRRGPGRRPAGHRAARGRRARDGHRGRDRHVLRRARARRRWPRPSLRLRRAGRRPRGLRGQRRGASTPPSSAAGCAPSSTLALDGLGSRRGGAGAGRHAAPAAWRARCEPPRGRGRRRCCAARRARGAVGLHDPARLRPARRGADAGLGAADRRRPVALPRLLVELRARASRCCSPALVKLFGPSLLWWRIVRVAVDATVSVLAFAYVRRDAGTGWALRRVGRRWRGRWRGPAAPGPTRPRCALALGALLPRAGRRWARARSPAWRSSCAPRSGSPRRSARRSRRGGRARGARRASPSRARRGAVAARALRDRRRRRHGRPGAGLRLACRTSSACPSRATTTAASTRTSCSSSTCPRSSWPAARCGRAGRSRAATASRWRRWSRSGSRYLLARTDEFHLVPLSVALAIALACAAGREARAPARARARRWRSRSSPCTAWSGGRARRCTRRRWRRSRRRRPTACARAGRRRRAARA